MKNFLLLFLVVFSIQTSTFSQQEVKACQDRKVAILLYNDGTWQYADSIAQPDKKATVISGLEIPKTKAGEHIITHSGYSLLFSDKDKLAKWVAYELTKEETNKIYDRTDKFTADPAVLSGTASNADYSGSGYDRGHLAPAADMGWSATAIAESFYYSNMTPQLPSFNRGVWKRLEELVRSWAIENEAVYIVTGPVLKNGLKTIGPDRVTVPEYFYKVVLDYTEPGINGIAFIIPNTASGQPLGDYAVTIDSVEHLTGIDFFPSLPDAQERAIEKTLCVDCWTWKSIKSPGKASGAKATVSAQCMGSATSGARCKNKTRNVSGYCYLHENQKQNNTLGQTPSASKSERKFSSVRCSGITKAGNRCKHMTYSPNGRCFQHGGN